MMGMINKIKFEIKIKNKSTSSSKQTTPNLGIVDAMCGYVLFVPLLLLFFYLLKHY